jgi:hypothetical protein
MAVGATAELCDHDRQSLKGPRGRIETGRWRHMTQELTQVFNAHIGLARGHGDMQLERKTKLAYRNIARKKQTRLFTHGELRQRPDAASCLKPHGSENRVKPQDAVGGH